MFRFSTLLLLIFILLPHFSGSQVPDFFNNVDFRVTPLTSINTPESEISPFFVEDALVFSAVREAFFGQEERRQNNTLFYDLYRTSLDAAGNPVTDRELVPGFGNLFHEGPAAWCAKTGELFVTVSNATPDSKPRSRQSRAITLRLVIMRFIEGRWVVTVDLPFNSDECNYAHPAISAGGDTLVFSSDREGGFGNSDLYMAVRKDGLWSTPVNLGERINTAGNDMFPTFGPGGMLFFSSDGHQPNYGQLDIYYTKLSGNAIPVNPGSQINSSFDDFGFTLHASKKFAFFSSNRYGIKNDDLFRADFLPLLGNIRGQVVNHNTGEPIQDVMVVLEDCDGNLVETGLSGYFGNFNFQVPRGGCYTVYATLEGYSSNTVSTPASGIADLRLKQIINYQLVINDFEQQSPLADVEVFGAGVRRVSNSQGNVELQLDSIFNWNFTVSKPGYFDFIFDLEPERFTPGTTVTDTIQLFKKEKGRIIPLKFLEYYMDLWRLLPASEPGLNQLVRLLENNPTLKVEISAHTDSKREDAYSMWLSRKRADAVVEYLIEKGIAEERLVAKGYGETRLLNKCANGVECTEKQHAVNRRTELVILAY